MFNITPENLHVYVFAILGILVIGFAVQFYIKSNTDAEINSLKKKVKKVQNAQQLMIMHARKKEHAERQQQLLQQKAMQEQKEREREEYEDNENDNDNDSYADPMMQNLG